ncbi:hypothetical protein NQD34_001538 [Periophthalmus magnuspinnatus]|nr:hypothetical protein NQD34_001538 [Periophthalmus magnuspinnatus]
MSHSVSDCVPSEEERDSPKTAPSAPCTPPGPPLRSRDDLYECNTHVCHRGHSTNSLLKGCKRKWTENTADDTENELFSHKCSELQCYLPPLSAILRGLKSGRYSDRLSSFQESLAMDRIQRILGVLQNPAPGGRFLSTVLKIEEMLQTWFPHIKDPSVCKTQKLCPVGPEWLYSSHDAPLHWLRPPLPECPAPSVTQDNAVSSSTDFLTAPPRDSTPPSFTIRSPCLERLLQAKESIIQTRTEARPAVNPD